MLGPNKKYVTALLLIAIAPMATIVAAVDRPVSAPDESSPAEWLQGADKSDQWKAATDRCRELLEQLNPQDALVAKHLPQLQEKVQLLLRSPDFDWKQKTAVEYLENMLEDLIAGREPHHRYAGKEFAYPYWSKSMERIEAIWTHVPPAYDSG